MLIKKKNLFSLFCFIKVYLFLLKLDLFVLKYVSFVVLGHHAPPTTSVALEAPRGVPRHPRPVAVAAVSRHTY